MLKKFPYLDSVNSRNFAYAKFREYKPTGNVEITMLFTDIGILSPSCDF